MPVLEGRALPLALPGLLAWLLLPGCGEPAPECGPAGGEVARVVDGDTLTLAEGPTVRLLLVDAPESTGGRRECHGPEAAAALRALAEGQSVTLHYGEACADRYGRLLAYVALGERELNTLLVERGLARVLFIPPAGATRRGALEAVEASARAARRGLWGACPEGEGS